MFRLLLKDFISSRIVGLGLFLVLAAGLIGIYNGRQHLSRQQANIDKTAHFQAEHIKRNVAFFNKDMGLLLYYLRFAYVNKAHPLNGLSIGQRDVNNSIQFINIRNLEAQKYDADLYNPVNLLTGNLDFGFVLIYLFPLLILAVCYNLLSEEQEGGTWPLLSVQSRAPVQVLVQKLLVRAVVIYGLLAVLFALAIPVLSLPFDAALVAAIGLAVAYLLFWFTICFWIVSWKQASAINAVSLLTIWVILTFILPAAINNYLTSRYPVPEALATTVEQREGYHARWDRDKKPTMDGFFARYPQFIRYSHTHPQSNWLWYYAMQQMGDEEAKDEAALLKTKLRTREAVSRRIAQFIPSLHAQLQLNGLSQAGLDNHLRFLDSTEVFHERLRLHFYPKIFDEAEARMEDWTRFVPEYFKGPVRPDWVGMFLPIVLLTLLLLLFSVFNVRRRFTTQ